MALLQFLDKSEDRSRNIRKARPSVRAQLTADKKTAARKGSGKKKKSRFGGMSMNRFTVEGNKPFEHLP